MKKGLLVLIIVCSAIIFAGLIFVGISIAVVGGNFERLGREVSYDEMNYSVAADGIQKIDVTDSNRKIFVRKSSDSQIHIKYYTNSKETYDISDQNGELVFKYKNIRKWYDYINIFNFDIQPVYTEILLPEHVFESLSAKTSNGAIEAQDFKLEGECYLKTSNGSVSLSNLEINGKITAESSNGKVTLSAVKSNSKISAYTSNSSIYLYNIEAGGVDADSGNGKVELESVKSTDTIKAGSSNGTITLSDVSSDTTIDVKTSNGKIELTRVAVGKSMTLKNSNGRISGTILGAMEDFNINSHTSNGDNNLPNGTTGKNKDLEIRTSNGKIEVQFVQE